MGVRGHRGFGSKSWAREGHQPLGAVPGIAWWQGQPGLLSPPAARSPASPPLPSPSQLLLHFLAEGKTPGTVGLLSLACHASVPAPPSPLPQQLPELAHVRELPPPASSALLLALLPPPLALWVPARSPAPWPRVQNIPPHARLHIWLPTLSPPAPRLSVVPTWSPGVCPAPEPGLQRVLPCLWSVRVRLCVSVRVFLALPVSGHSLHLRVSV